MSDNVVELFDMWADEAEPHTREKATLYRIQPPRPHDTKIWCDLLVFEHDLIEIVRFKHYNIHGPMPGGYNLSEAKHREVYDAEQAIMQWLSEWDLITIRSIGEEDQEWFATEELLKSKVKTQAYDRKHTYPDEA